MESRDHALPRIAARSAAFAAVRARSDAAAPPPPARQPPTGCAPRPSTRARGALPRLHDRSAPTPKPRSTPQAWRAGRRRSPRALPRPRLRRAGAMGGRRRPRSSRPRSEAEAANDPRRADFWVQAGNAWLAGGDGAQALQADSTPPCSPRASTDAAARRGHARPRPRPGRARPRRPGARTEIDSALQLVPNDRFAWYLSAALARRENDLVRAAHRHRPRPPARARRSRHRCCSPARSSGLGRQYGRGRARSTARWWSSRPDSDAGRQAAASLATVREIEEAAPAPTHCAQPTPAPAPPRTPTPAGPAQPHRRPARARGSRSLVQVEFDRGHDAHLLEGRVAARRCRLPRRRRRRAAPIEK